MRFPHPNVSTLYEIGGIALEAVAFIGGMAGLLGLVVLSAAVIGGYGPPPAPCRPPSMLSGFKDTAAF